MKKRFLHIVPVILSVLLFIFITSTQLFGQAAVNDFRTRYTGSYNWATASNWQICTVAGTPGTWATASYYPGNGTTGVVTVQSGAIYTLNVSPANAIGALVITGTLTASSYTLSVSGDWTNNGTFNSNTSTVIMSGSNNANIIGTVQTAFYNLTINKNANATTVTNPGTSGNYDFHVNNLLTVTRGNLVLSSNTGPSDYNINNITVTFTNSSNYGTLTQSTGSNRIWWTGTSIACDGMWVGGSGCSIAMAGAAAFIRSNPNPENFTSPPYSQFPMLTTEGTTNNSITFNGTVRVNVDAGTTALKFPNHEVSGSTATIPNTSHLISNGVWHAGANSGTSTLNIQGPVDLDGDFEINTGCNIVCSNTPAINIKGNLTNYGNGTFNTATSTFNFNGSSAQSIGGSTATTFNNLTLNNGSGLSLSGSTNTTVSGILTLTAGVVTTNANYLIVSNTATGAISGGSAASYINGNLRRNILAGANTYAYPTGTSTAYAPVSLAFTSGTLTGYLNGKTTDGDHANIGTSTFRTYRTVNRNWTFAIVSGMGTANYGATFNWVAGDQDAGFDYNTAYVGKYTGSTWSYPTVGARNPTSAQITGVIGFSDFQVGNSCLNPDIPTLAATFNPICNGGSTILSIATGNLNDAAGWQWYTGSCGGTPAGSGTSVSFSPTTNTTYYVRGEGGCVTPGSCANMTITVNALPVSSVTGQTNPTCYAGTNGTITISASGGTSPYSYSVDNGSGWIASGTNPYQYGGLVANHAYQIRVKDSNGCISK